MACLYDAQRRNHPVDLVVAFESGDIARLTAALGEDYLVDADAIGDALRSARHGNIPHLPSLVKIDLIPRKNTGYRATAQ